MSLPRGSNCGGRKVCDSSGWVTLVVWDCGLVDDDDGSESDFQWGIWGMQGLG